MASLGVFAQQGQQDTVPFMVGKRLALLDSLRTLTIKAATDVERKAANTRFYDVMKNTLQDPRSFAMSFDTLSRIGDLRSPDGFFRLVTWNLPFDDLTNKYFAFVQYPGRRKKDGITVIELKDTYNNLDHAERKVFSEGDWYGALYYEIIPVSGSKRRKVYTLLGWDGKDRFSSAKVVDIMTISNGRLRFGADLFRWPQQNIRRLVLEYKSDAAVSLKFDPRKNRIVFNQLVPVEPTLVGMYEFYVPVLEYDALLWRRGKWEYRQNVDVRVDTKGKPFTPPPLPMKEPD